MPTNPELLKMPFAKDGDKNSIPETTSPTTGAFSQQYGFQEINSLPLNAGGKAISRLDYNGAMYMLSNLLYYMQRGYTFVYDDDMPYVVGCRVLDPNDGQVYNCIADASAGTGAPSVTPANWALEPSADVLGFRKPDTDYETGNIAYHPSLPTGWYLECTTAGTTSSGDLTISSPVIGRTVSDGTALWIIQANSNSLVAQNYAILSDANLCRQTGHYDIYYAYDHTNLPTTGDNGTLVVFRNSADPSGVRVNQIYISNDNQQIYLRSAEGLTDADWTPWQLQESIVTKSLGTNGFVKYASGLIVQFGYAVGAPSAYDNIFPITFPTAISCVIPVTFGSSSLVYCTVARKSTSGFSLRTSNTSGNVDAYYIAIGY